MPSNTTTIVTTGLGVFAARAAWAAVDFVNNVISTIVLLSGTKSWLQKDSRLALPAVNPLRSLRSCIPALRHSAEVVVVHVIHVRYLDYHLTIF